MCRSEARGIESHTQPRRSRSPLVPQFGGQLPTPGRSLLNASGSVHVFLFARGLVLDSRGQEALRVEGDLLAPQVVDRAAELRLQDRQRLALAALLLLT